MAILHLVHGFVGVGKTTFSKDLEAKTGAIRFTLDEWMIALYGSNPPVEQFASYEQRTKALIVDLAMKLLNKNIDVILDFGFWQRKDRDDYRALAQKWGVRHVLYKVHAEDEVILQRVGKRTKEMPEGAFFIDQAALSQFKNRFEALESDECAIEVAG